jgi:hypothetical protein
VSGGTATASVYSGRPDPEWAITEQQCRAVRAAWKELPAATTPPPPPPPLGYRGVAVRYPSGEHWFAYGGVVTLKVGKRAPEYRHDRDRRFEQALLDTAPAGVLPSQLATLR